MSLSVLIVDKYYTKFPRKIERIITSMPDMHNANVSTINLRDTPNQNHADIVIVCVSESVNIRHDSPFWKLWKKRSELWNASIGFCLPQTFKGKIPEEIADLNCKEVIFYPSLYKKFSHKGYERVLSKSLLSLLPV